MKTPLEESENFLRIEKEKLTELETYQANLIKGIENVKHTISETEKRIEELKGKL